MATIDRSSLPGTVTIANANTSAVEIPMFRVDGLSAKIASGDSLTLKVTTSAELVYYMDKILVAGVTSSYEADESL